MTYVAQLNTMLTDEELLAFFEDWLFLMDRAISRGEQPTTPSLPVRPVPGATSTSNFNRTNSATYTKRVASFCAKLHLDKPRGMWYNGARRVGRLRPQYCTTPSAVCQEEN